MKNIYLTSFQYSKNGGIPLYRVVTVVTTANMTGTSILRNINIARVFATNIITYSLSNVRFSLFTNGERSIINQSIYKQSEFEL